MNVRYYATHAKICNMILYWDGLFRKIVKPNTWQYKTLKWEIAQKGL